MVSIKTVALIVFLWNSKIVLREYKKLYSTMPIHDSFPASEGRNKVQLHFPIAFSIQKKEDSKIN